ncbi:MAG: sigma-70 family RNA polymerase sigma factor [Actinomycetota bacterium]
MAIAQHSASFGRLRDLRTGGSRDFRSDKSLIRAAQSGGGEAASQLIERHYPRIYSFVSYLTNGRSHAEDLTQEVFARALTSLGTFNGRYQFEPWLIRIAKNLVIDESRRDVHRPFATDPEDLPELENVSPDTDNVWNSMSQQMASSQVKTALEKLPPRQRTALVLKEIEGMSYAEIAQVIGTNIRGVEGTLRRAKARFRLEASAVEGAEGQRAVCKRALRLVALNGEAPGSEASRHLKDCPDCRTKSQSIHASDALFAALPVFQFVKPAWSHQLVSNLVANPSSGLGWKLKLEKLADTLKAGPGGQMAAPMVQALHVAGSLALAGAVSLTAVAGYQEVKQQISPVTAFSAPVFTQTFQADPAKLPVAYFVETKAPGDTTVNDAPAATLPLLPAVNAPAVLQSVLDLLGATLPNLSLKQLPIQSQLNLLSELPGQALIQLAETLNLPAIPTDKDALLQAIKDALIKAAPVTSPPTQSPAPTTLASPPSSTLTTSATTSTSP